MTFNRFTRAGHPIATALQVARLRRRFGVTLETATILAELIYGEGRQ